MPGAPNFANRVSAERPSDNFNGMEGSFKLKIQSL